MHRHVDADTMNQYRLDVPVRELAAKAADEGVSLLGYFSIVRGVLLQQFQLAAAVNDKNGTAVLAGRLVEVLREIGKLTGEVLRSPAVMNINGNINIMNNPVLANLQANILKALAPFPAAREAVVMAIRDTESAPAATAVPEMKVIEHHAAT
jgi:hypothetical protein